MSELTAADVREAFDRMASGEWPEAIARALIEDRHLVDCLYSMAWQVARERAAMAAEARAEGDR